MEESVNNSGSGSMSSGRGFQFSSSSTTRTTGRRKERYTTSEYIEMKPERSSSLYSPEMSLSDLNSDLLSSDYSTEAVDDYTSKLYKLSDSFSIVTMDSDTLNRAEKPYHSSANGSYDCDKSTPTQTSAQKSKPMSSSFMYGSLMKGPITSPVTSTPGSLNRPMTSTERRFKPTLMRQSFNAGSASSYDSSTERNHQKSIEDEIDSFRDSVKGYKEVLSSSDSTPKSAAYRKIERNAYGGTFFSGDPQPGLTPYKPTRDLTVSSLSDTGVSRKSQPISKKVTDNQPMSFSDTFVKTIRLQPVKSLDIEFVEDTNGPSNLSDTYLVGTEGFQSAGRSEVQEVFVKDTQETSESVSVDSEMFTLPRMESVEVHSKKRRHHSSGSVTSAHSDTNISRLITEEDLVDTIFYSCDPENTGTVSVSALLDYIRMIMLPAQLNESGDIEELGRILDPGCQDTNINLQTYHSGVTKWIESLQKRKNAGEETDDVFPDGTPRQVPLESTPNTSRWEKSRHRQPGSSPKKGIHDLSLVSYGSLEGVPDEVPTSDNDLIELQNQIEDLQHQVKKLTEQNVKLHAQMETTEDANAALIQEVEDLKTKHKSSHEAILRANSVREENEDLRGAIATLEENNKDLRVKCTQMEKEKSIVDVRISNLQDELQRASLNLEAMQRDNKHVRINMEETKKRSQEIEEQIVIKEVELTEKTRKLEDLHTMVEEMSRLNKDLKSEKIELENQLTEAKQEIAGYHAEKEAQLEEENEVKVQAEEVISPIITSTPFRRDLSLHSELHSLVSADNNLPSPLCGNDLLEDTIGSDIMSTSSVSMSMDKFSQIATQISSDFQRKKEFILQQLSKLSSKDLSDDNLPTPEKLKEDVEQNVEFFVDKVKSLAEMKKDSDKKAGRLSKEVRQLRDENRRIHQKHEEAIKLLHNLSQSEVESNIEIQERLKQSLTGEQVKVQDLQSKLTDTYNELESVREEAKILTTALERQLQSRSQLETELEQLKETLRESEESAQDNYNKAAVVGEQLLKTKQDLRKEKQKTKELQESHKTELGNILQLLPDEKQNQETDNQSTVTGQSVQEAVNFELQKLQKELSEYKQTAINSDASDLEKLKNGLQLDHQLSPAIYAKHPPSLLNALTLENLEFQRDSAKHILLELASSLSSSRFILPPLPQTPPGDLRNPDDGRLTSNANLNSSCPELASCQNTKVSSATQTDLPEDQQSLDGLKSDCTSSTDTSLSSAYLSLSSDGQLKPGEVCLSESQLSIFSEYSFHTVPSSEKIINLDTTECSSTTEEGFVSYENSPSTGVPEQAVVAEQIVERVKMSSRHPPLIATQSPVIEESDETDALIGDNNIKESTGKQNLPKWQQEILQQNKECVNEDDKEKHDVIQTEGEDKRKLSASRMKLKAMHDQEKGKTTLTTDGKLIDLINGDLEDIELTEADKRFNEQLLEEARKVSQKFQSRKGRTTQRSNSLNVSLPKEERSQTPSPTRLSAPVHELPRAKSFESLDMEKDVNKADLKPLDWKLPEEKHRDVDEQKEADDRETSSEEKEMIEDTNGEKSPERRDSEDLDIKADILKALQPKQKDADIAVKALPKIHQPLSKLREVSTSQFFDIK